jgi:hypothetical protein
MVVACWASVRWSSRAPGFSAWRARIASISSCGRKVKTLIQLVASSSERIQPELVVGVGAGAVGGEPDGAGLGLAELGAVGLGDEGGGDAEGLLVALVRALVRAHPPDQIRPRHDVPVLIAAADLDGHALVLVEVGEVVGLEDHVGELGVGDPLLAVVEPRLYRLLLHHHVDAEVLADVAEGLDVAQPAQPVEVVDDRVVGALNRAEDGLVDRALSVDIGRDDVGGVELALGGLARGVADEARAAPHDDDGGVPRALDMGEEHDRDEVADREAGRRGVEPRVDLAGGVRGVGEVGAQAVRVGALVEQAPPLELGDEVGDGGRRRVGWLGLGHGTQG